MIYVPVMVFARFVGKNAVTAKVRQTVIYTVTRMSEKKAVPFCVSSCVRIQLRMKNDRICDFCIPKQFLPLSLSVFL